MKIWIFQTSDKIWLTKVREFVRNYQTKACSINKNMNLKTKTSSKRLILFSNSLLLPLVKYTAGTKTTRAQLRDNFTNQRPIEPQLELPSQQWPKINRDSQICKITDTNKGSSGWLIKRMELARQAVSLSRLTSASKQLRGMMHWHSSSSSIRGHRSQKVVKFRTFKICHFHFKWSINQTINQLKIRIKVKSKRI